MNNSSFKLKKEKLSNGNEIYKNDILEINNNKSGISFKTTCDAEISPKSSNER